MTIQFINICMIRIPGLDIGMFDRQALPGLAIQQSQNIQIHHLQTDENILILPKDMCAQAKNY